jgi:hypothetical protein
MTEASGVVLAMHHQGESTANADMCSAAHQFGDPYRYKNKTLKFGGSFPRGAHEGDSDPVLRLLQGSPKGVK